MVGNLSLQPEATLSAVDHMRDVSPFRYTWPEAGGCLDDPVVAALAAFGDKLRAAVTETQAALDELGDGARAAVATFEQAERQLADGLATATRTISAASTTYEIKVAD